jgi:signal transduction histidine kinase/CheY-like chemotaxis protein
VALMESSDSMTMARTTAQRRLALVVATVNLVVVAALDVATPNNIMGPVLYGVPIACLIWTRDRRLLWIFALAAVLLTVVVGVWGRPPTYPEGWWPAMVNRSFVSLTILTIAALAQFQTQALEIARRQRESLARQNTDLEELNEQISQREEEIVRQNEELQSQAEELERQSEELRLSNEELASWEKRLEQLLELSRSLTAELDRDEILHKICESLGLLSEGRPAAILESHGDDLRVVCHHGFGPEGPDEETVPRARSFASLVMSVGQTAYVEDIELRPELRLPRARGEEPFRSVLASPLFVRGRAIGTIEVYSPQPRAWGQSDVSMIESLAAQASVSLQGAELVDQIRRERRRFEAAFRTVPFGLAITDDPQCRDVRINPAAAALFNVALTDNISPHTTLGARLAARLFRGEQPASVDGHPLMRAVRGEEFGQEEFDLSLPHGKRAALLTSAAPILSEDGRILGAVCAFVDISLQKAFERELELRRREAEEANLRKTRFLAAVSHDIRTPANAIGLMVELIRRYAADANLAHEIPPLAGHLQRNTAALLELVDDMLDLARFDSGKVELMESEFLLNQLIAQEVEHLQPIARDKGIELAFESKSDDARLRTDRVKLARVLGNLIGNALKFTERGGVRVESLLTTDRDRRVLVRVSDTGIGIAPEHLASIFDEFAQMNNPARDRGKGSGLGLAICRRLLDVMGGSVEVTSEVGRGSTFTVALPATSVVPGGLPPQVAIETNPARVNPAIEGAVIEGAATAPLTMSILLVDDHAGSRHGTARLLREEGATVVEAADGAAALALIAERMFDILLADMMLPDIDGREVVRAALARGGERPLVLVLTGDLTAERRAEIDRMGVDGLVEKPINIDRLIARLRAANRTNRRSPSD